VGLVDRAVNPLPMKEILVVLEVAQGRMVYLVLKECSDKEMPETPHLITVLMGAAAGAEREQLGLKARLRRCLVTEALVLQVPSMAQSRLTLEAEAAVAELGRLAVLEEGALEPQDLLAVRLVLLTQVVAAEVADFHLFLVVQVAPALLSFAIQLHTLMQLHTHQPPKQHQTGIRFIPSLPLEQSPSKE
jgi:hypothetical protein